MDITETDIDTLATKLAGLQLTDGERSALDTVFGAAVSGEDVEGFASLRAGDVKGTGGKDAGYTEVEWTYAKVLRSFNDGYMKIEMEK